jgi:hypothetical protein
MVLMPRLEIAVESGLQLAVGLDEGRVAVDRVVALADDELRMRDVQPLVEGALGALDAGRATGPDCRRAADVSNGFLPGWEEANEMCPACAILRQHHVLKPLAILLMRAAISSPP